MNSRGHRQHRDKTVACVHACVCVCMCVSVLVGKSDWYMYLCLWIYLSTSHRSVKPNFHGFMKLHRHLFCIAIEIWWVLHLVKWTKCMWTIIKGAVHTCVYDNPSPEYKRQAYKVTDCARPLSANTRPHQAVYMHVYTLSNFWSQEAYCKVHITWYNFTRCNMQFGFWGEFTIVDRRSLL